MMQKHFTDITPNVINTQASVNMLFTILLLICYSLLLLLLLCGPME